MWHDQSLPGGYTLQMHTENPVTWTLIEETNWNYVVLQEQSQLPSWPPDSVELLVYPYADTLNKWIKRHDSCSKTLFFMTWGRRNGDAENCPWYPPVCTYTGMQARLRQSYLEMGQLNNAEVSPVGVAWQHIRETYPSMGLYSFDGSHPNVYGSYLAACTFYSCIFGKSPVGGAFPPAIPADTASILQQIAYHTVFDSLQNWYIDTSRVYAFYSAYYLGNNTFRFTNGSINAVQYYWDFGDGQHSTLEDPEHTFPGTGDYIVRLIAGRKCDTNSFSRTQTIVSVNPKEMKKEAGLYPNPAQDRIWIDNGWLTKNGSAGYSVIDAKGKVLLTGNVNPASPSISLKDLNSGSYTIVLTSNGQTYPVKVIHIR
jgi:hypothetical protein